MNFLNDHERVQLKLQHKQERDGRVRDRIKAVLLHDKGWSPQQIAEALLISDQAVRNHIENYTLCRKLKPENGGSEEKLPKKQSDELEAHLRQYTYLYVKDIIAYVQETFHVVYTVPGMRNWLQRHEFSYKKPALVPGKANKEQQEQWMAEYEKLRRELPRDETICFTDGVHPTHNVQPAYGWIKKGIRKEIPANTGRSRLNLSGAIDVVNHNVLIQADQTLNAKSTIRFFQKIEEAYQHKRKIHVFCDNAPYYRNKEVREYLKNSKIALHFLPPYSPNLNPIERLWKWMKERVIYNTYYEHFEEFKAAVLGFLAVLSTFSRESILGKNFRSRIRDHFRPIGA
ncbi:MAG TPA: IS630 family transposase [Chlamydiales bacterium]|nr:IS630 family transposase [Chlamydiales bacterium]